MELAVWSGDWGIPSVNPKCLTVMAYTKFSKAPVEVKATNNPWKSPCGTLPVLRHQSKVMTNVPEMFNHLRASNYGCEFELSAAESADMVAMIAMVEQKLAPAINHLFWVDAKGYSEITRPWYGKACGLPLSLYYPNRYRDDMEKSVYNSHPNLNEEDIQTKIYKNARECMNNLSSKLSSSDFFFNNHPTALDAVVYGYLAPLLKAPLHINTLSGHLKAHENLQGFIRRIQFRYFAEEIKNLSEHQDQTSHEAKLDLEEFPNKKRNIILSALFVISAMVSYAFLSGMVQIEITHKDDFDEDQDHDGDDEGD